MRFSKWNLNTLRTKIIAWSFVPTLIILTAVAWYTFYAYQRVTSDLVMRQDQQVVELRVRQITEQLVNTFNPVLTPLLFNPDFMDLSSADQRDEILQSSAINATFDGGTLLIDGNGDIVAALPPRPDLQDYPWNNDRMVREAVQNLGRGTFSAVKPVGPGGSQVVALTMAVRSTTDEQHLILLGLMRVDPDPDTTLNRLFARASLGENTYVVDNQGILLYSPDPALIGTERSSEPVLAQVLRDEPLASQSYDAQGNPLVVNYAPVFIGREWILVKAEPLADLMAPSRPYTSMLLALLGMGVVIPSIVVSFGLRRILKPVDDLIAATKEIAGGNFGKRIPVASNDELAELAAQFNRMSEELQISYSMLEQRVEERTRQIATLNATTAVVSRSLDLKEVLSGALEEIIESLPFETGAAYHQVGERLERVTLCGMPEDACAAFDQVQHLEDVHARLNIYITAELTEPELRQRLEAGGIRMIVTLPLVAKGQRLGLLALGAQQVQEFSPGDQALMVSIAEQVAVAVENARLYAQAEEAAVAEERSRLARDLHDAVTQTLFSTSLIAEALPQIYAANPAEGQRRAEELRQLTRGALAEMRTLLLELRPNALAEARLEDLLRQLGDAVIGRARIPVRLETQGAGRLPAAVHVALYRIAQESLNNIVKHAHAAQIDMQLELSPSSARLVISDDGQGFDPAGVQGDHFGLSIMRERASAVCARLVVRSAPGQGTHISVEWAEQACL